MLRFLADWECRDLPERGTYRNAKEAFLAQVGYTVGLGNFWRFPYLCYRYGGATFLIAYVVCMLCVGLPLYLMELSLGQYLGLGPTHLLAYMCPLLSGVGWGMAMLLFMISVYYNVVLSWSLFYMGASLTSPLPWSHCRNVENEIDCVPYAVNQSYESANSYFKHVVLGQPQRDDEDPYALHLWLVLCLAVAWVVVGVCLVQGIRHTGKLFYVTVIYPYVVLLCLFGMNYEHINASQWVKTLSSVNTDKLLQPEIWSAAASQVIYSLGVGHGIVMVASHNRLHHNVVRDTFLVCLLDLGTSVFCSKVLYSLTVSISPQMIQDSNGISPLVFKLFSAMLSRTNSSLWSFLFFTMIFALGFDSLLLMVAAVTTTLQDQFRQLAPFRPLVIILTCCAMFLLGLSMCTRNGITVFNIMNDYTAKHSLLFLALLEVVVASYFYGYRKLLKLIQQDLRVWVPLPIRWYLILTWGLVTPVCLVLLLGITLYTEEWTRMKDGNLSFIGGQVIALTPAVLVPIFALYVCCTKGNKNVKDLVSATPDFHSAKFRENNREPAPANGAIPMQNYAYRVEHENYI